MSVSDYLDSLSSKAILKNDELTSIRTSILYLKDNLEHYFNGELSGTFQFGSSKRETILPRKMDENSDIDYMIVFKNHQLMPHTYLKKLKDFAEKYYHSSIVHQSSPAVVLELNHIKFDLVPAIDKGYEDYHSYYIPAKRQNSYEWINTSPNDFCEKIRKKNIEYNYKIKPMVRLVKYWNAINSHPFESFDLEQDICSYEYVGLNSIRDFLFDYMLFFNATHNSPQWVKDKIIRAKNIIKNVQAYENAGYYPSAMNEIKKLLPEVY